MSTPDLQQLLQQPKKGKWKKWVVLLVLITGAAFWWTKRQGNTPEAGPKFITEPLAIGNLNLSITATGNLEPTTQVTVGSELSGTTLEVYVDSNDLVTKGQSLATLDTNRLSRQIEASNAGLSSAKARVAQAEATVREQEATLARQKELHRISGGKVPSKAEMDNAIAATDRARADLGSAQAAVSESEAQVRILESDLAKTTIRSPIDGIVLTRSLEPGQTVAASFTAPELFVIAEKLEQMKLKVAIAEADIGRVQIGQKATFTVDAWPDRKYRATVTKVAFGSAVTDNVVTYQTELEVTNDDLSLRPGMTATAEIAVAERESVFLVPNAALRFNPEAATAAAQPQEKKSFVDSLVPRGPRRNQRSGRPGGGGRPGPRAPRAPSQIWILKDGKPTAIPVQTGLTDGRQTEISGDALTEGLPVILRAAAPSARP